MGQWVNKSVWGCIKIYTKLYYTLCHFHSVKNVTKEKIQNDIEIRKEEETKFIRLLSSVWKQAEVSQNSQHKGYSSSMWMLCILYGLFVGVQHEVSCIYLFAHFSFVPLVPLPLRKQGSFFTPPTQSLPLQGGHICCVGNA